VKWEKGSEAYNTTKSAAARNLDDDVVRRLQQTAVQVYSALKLRDYGRVDMRLAAGGSIHVIEANPNPWLAPEAELAIAAKQAGISYVQLIGQIVELALARYTA
jgi:D-alanine-D-alanine ligase